MKKHILLISIIIVSCFKSNATIFSVSNDPITSAQSNTAYFFTTIQAAYNACSSSVIDTIMLEGTNLPYEISTAPSPWAKAIVVVGIGFNPAKANPRHSQIRGIGAATFFVNNLGNGSKFYGIEFTNIVSAASTIVNYSFVDCIFQATVSINPRVNCQDLYFTNCVFTSTGANFDASAGTNGYSNILFTSCIFNAQIEGNTNAVGIGTLTFDHCLFLNSSLNFSSIKNCIVRNSIFMNNSGNVTGGTTYGNFQFYNNMSRLGNAGNFPPTANGSTGSGNFVNTGITFTSYTPPNAYSSTHIYKLTPGSPGTHGSSAGEATDNTDIGLHGGISNFSETGEVLFTPIVRSLIINNTNVTPNGTLNIQINAEKPRDN